MSATDRVDMVYCSAVAVIRMNGGKIKQNEKETGKKGTENGIKPSWQIRLEKQIEETRSKLGRMTQKQKGNSSRRLQNKVNRILEEEKLKRHSKYEENNTIEEIVNTLK
jgi:hypothetical protein